MKLWMILCLCGCVLTGCAPEPVENLSLQGTLVWNDSQQTLTTCDETATYLVRIGASNPSFYVYYRVQELEAHNPGQAIIANVDGVLKPVPTPAPDYPVDGALFVNRIHSLEAGTCE